MTSDIYSIDEKRLLETWIGGKSLSIEAEQLLEEWGFDHDPCRAAVQKRRLAIVSQGRIAEATDRAVRALRAYAEAVAWVGRAAPTSGPGHARTNARQADQSRGIIMAKFLIKGSYTAEGAKALVKEGGSRRKAAVEQMLSGLGGKVEAFYFALGDSDVYVILDVPDTISGAALSLAVNASGTVRLSTTMLMTPEEVDAACKKTVSYRAPGQ